MSILLRLGTRFGKTEPGQGETEGEEPRETVLESVRLPRPQGLLWDKTQRSSLIMVPRHPSPFSRALSSVETSNLAYCLFAIEATSELSFFILDR